MEEQQSRSRWWLWGISSLFFAVTVYVASYGPFMYLWIRFKPSPILKAVEIIYDPLLRISKAGNTPQWYKSYLRWWVGKGYQSNPRAIMRLPPQKPINPNGIHS